MNFVTRSDYEKMLDALVKHGTGFAGYKLTEGALPGVVEIVVRVNWWSVFLTDRLQAVANATYGAFRDGQVMGVWIIVHTTPFPIRWRWLWEPLSGLCTEDNWVDVDAAT